VKGNPRRRIRHRYGELHPDEEEKVAEARWALMDSEALVQSRLQLRRDRALALEARMEGRAALPAARAGRLRGLLDRWIGRYTIDLVALVALGAWIWFIMRPVVLDLIAAFQG
jgi:hypothetical protein